MRRIAYIGLVGAIAAVLSGCAVADDADPEPPTTVVAPSASASAEPTPAAGDVTAWVLSDEGAGPLRLGMPIDEALAALPGAEHVCHDLVYAAPGAGADERLWVVQADGVLVHIESSLADGPRTVDGLGVGSTRDELLAAHPARTFEPQNLAWLTDGDLFFGFREGITYNADGTETDERSGADLVVSVGVATAGPVYEFCG